MNRKARLIVALLLAASASACASTSHAASDRANAALAVASATTGPKSGAPTPSGCGPADPADITRSFRPYETVPPPGQMPANTFLADIARRGSLHAGVDENTLPLSFRDPRTGAFKGFEIDVLNDIANAIIGTPANRGSHLRPIPVITSEKVSVVQDGDVDLTASAVSI